MPEIRNRSPKQIVGVLAGAVIVGVPVITAAAALLTAVSIVATPIFASINLFQIAKSKYYYRKTLDKNGQRAEFGRLAHQDFTQVDGKALAQIRPRWKLIEQERRTYRKKEMYKHNQINVVPDFYNQLDGSQTTAFSSKEDLKWLDKEMQYRKALANQKLCSHLLEVIACFALPLIGCFMAVNKSNSYDRLKSRDYWSAQTAIDYHKRVIHRQFNPEVY